LSGPFDGIVIFPELLLLICRAHLRRSWKNHRDKVLKGNTPAVALVSNCLRGIEGTLVKTTSIDVAKSLIAEEVLALEAMKIDEISESAAQGGLEHLHYLSSYWISTKDLWASWSDFIFLPTSNSVVQSRPQAAFHSHAIHPTHSRLTRIPSRTTFAYLTVDWRHVPAWTLFAKVEHVSTCVLPF